MNMFYFVGLNSGEPLDQVAGQEKWVLEALKAGRNVNLECYRFIEDLAVGPWNNPVKGVVE